MHNRTMAGAAALALSVLLAAPAAAQTREVNFGGFYVGAQVGYGWTSAEGSATVGGATAAFDDSEGGVNGGVFLGYGVQLGAFYIGIEGEASLSSAEYEESSGGITGRIEQKHTFGAGARLGYRFLPNAMLYGRAGVVQTNFEASATNGATTISDDDDLTGIRFGGGIEVGALTNLSMRVEYTRTDYDEQSYASGANSARVDVDEDLIRFGLAYRF